jgi:nitrite reductase/ring-hydroxylating ferredoxin subunit
MNHLYSRNARHRASRLVVASVFCALSTAALAGNGNGNDNGKAWGRIAGWSGGKDKCDPTPAAPVIDGLPAFDALEGLGYAFTPSASDVNCDTLVFAIANKPSWASFDTTTGSLTGTPKINSRGTYAAVTISVNDGTYTSSLPPFDIEVYGNSVPLIYGTPPTKVMSDTSYDFQPEASDPDGQPLSFNIAGKPSWAAFDASTGRLSGTPSRTDKGTYGGITVSVTDGLETSSLPTFSVTVEATNAAPSISGTPSTSVSAGQAYAFTPGASDPDNDPLSFSIQNKPAWASFDSGSGKLYGTPTKEQAGTYTNILISASDGTLSDSLPAFGIEVQVVNGVPVIRGTPSGSVVVGQAYSFLPEASDPDGDPLTFSLANRPAWVTFNTTNGQLSGSPQSADVGQYVDITIAVSDGKAESKLGPFSISVDAIVNGTATLSWQPPTQRTDGSVLNNLAGYHILWGSSPDGYTNRVRLDNPGLTSYVVENLAQGTWYFVMTAFDAAGAESDYSAVGAKTIQ